MAGISLLGLLGCAFMVKVCKRSPKKKSATYEHQTNEVEINP